MRHIIIVQAENEPGVLSRIAGLFSGRGYNIESLTVAETLDKNFARFTIVTKGKDEVIEQISKQLNRLINTIKVIDLSEENLVERELVLIKVNASRDDVRSELLRVAGIFNANVVDVTGKTYTLEVMGSPSRIKSFIELLKPYGIKEMARSGAVAIGKDNVFAEIK